MVLRIHNLALRDFGQDVWHYRVHGSTETLAYRLAYRIAGDLRRLADGIQEARPFLSDVYRSLSEELTSSLLIPNAPFRLKLPEGVIAQVNDTTVTVSPPDFDAAKYHQRLLKRASS